MCNISIALLKLYVFDKCKSCANRFVHPVKKRSSWFCVHSCCDCVSKYICVVLANREFVFTEIEKDDDGDQGRARRSMSLFACCKIAIDGLAALCKSNKFCTCGVAV